MILPLRQSFWGNAIMAGSEKLETKTVRLRQMAAEAETFAKSSMYPETRNDYLKLARNWRALADDLERAENSH
jgi:hypothetical protein